jgi:hypothetical protein
VGEILRIRGDSNPPDGPRLARQVCGHVCFSLKTDAHAATSLFSDMLMLCWNDCRINYDNEHSMHKQNGVPADAAAAKCSWSGRVW